MKIKNKWVDLSDSAKKIYWLQDCTIILHGPIQALYLHKLRKCHIQAGPVSGATFGENMTDCTVMVASHQVRLHHAQNSQFYIAVGSDPIIEFSDGLGFAPLLDLPYAQYSDALQVARIKADNELWSRVQDFQYPGHTVSPNWCTIPAEIRVQPQAPSQPEDCATTTA